jgi:uncharacterized protein involved in response to NO
LQALVKEPRTQPPFVNFFLFASIDAVAGVGIFLPLLLAGVDPMEGLAGSPFAWHGRELMFGYASGVCTGFMLTALPRWTGRTPGRISEAVLLVLWLAGRFAVALPPAFAPIIAAPLIALAAVVSYHVIAAADWRDLKVVALLWLWAVGGLVATVPAVPGAPELGLRIGIAASTGLVMIIGGRVARSLTESLLVLRGQERQLPHATAIEVLAAFGAATGLLVWLLDPSGPLMAAAGSFAAATQSLRLLQWRGWSVMNAPAIFIFHVAYAFVPLGFALFAASVWSPALMPAGAALHAWTAGAIGLMTLGVMASMIRRRFGRSFMTSRIGLAVFALAIAAASLRVATGFSGVPAHGLALAAACWVAAFALFVCDFRVPLLKRA